MAVIVGIVELAGGLLIALGLLTRPAALALGADMAGAIRRVHWSHGLVGPGGFEFPLTMLASCVALIGSGPGELSLAHLADAKSPPGRRLRSAIPWLVGAAFAGLAYRSARVTFQSQESAVTP
jgi:hypothetical protein